MRWVVARSNFGVGGQESSPQSLLCCNPNFQVKKINILRNFKQ